MRATPCIALHAPCTRHAPTPTRTRTRTHRVDKGTAPLEDGAPGELHTQGLVGLDARCRELRAASNATFAKWRAVFSVSGDGSGRDGGAPSERALTRSAGDLAEFAAVMQGCGLVPVVEPEVRK
jgi:fructose-bisphosphate aldolase class I